MRTFIRYKALLLLLVSLVFGPKDAVNAVHGTITKLDRAAKTVVVKTADGTEHTLHLVGKTTVRGCGSYRQRGKGIVSWCERGYGSSRSLHVRGGKETAVEL